MKFFKYIFILFVSGFIYGAEREPVDIFEEVTSWEDARRTFDNALMQPNLEKKMRLYRSLLVFYEKQKPIPYEDILRVYISEAMDYIDVENFEEANKIKIFIKDLPQDFHYGAKDIDIMIELQKNNLETIVKLCDEYEKIRGIETPFVKIYKGLAYMQAGEYIKAKEMFSYILKKAPKAHYEKLYRAICFSYLKQFDDALKDLNDFRNERKIVKPKSLFYYYKAICLYNKGDYVKARECIEKGRQINVVNIEELSRPNDDKFKKKIEAEIEEIVLKMNEAEKSGSSTGTGK